MQLPIFKVRSKTEQRFRMMNMHKKITSRSTSDRLRLDLHPSNCRGPLVNPAELDSPPSVVEMNSFVYCHKCRRGVFGILCIKDLVFSVSRYSVTDIAASEAFLDRRYFHRGPSLTIIHRIALKRLTERAVDLDSFVTKWTYRSNFFRYWPLSGDTLFQQHRKAEVAVLCLAVKM